MCPRSTILGFGYVVGHRCAAATSVLTPELGEGAERPKAGKVEDFAYCAPLNFSWPRFR